MLRTREQDGNTSVARRPARRQSVFDALFQPAFPELTIARGLMSALTPAMAEAAQFVPSVELAERDGNYLIDVALPGFRSEDIDIEIAGNEVTITGRYERKREDAKTRYSEMQQASFTRTIVLPQEIDPDRVTASLENGVLRIVAPPVQRITSRHVQIAGRQDGADRQDAGSAQQGTQQSTPQPAGSRT